MSRKILIFTILLGMLLAGCSLGKKSSSTIQPTELSPTLQASATDTLPPPSPTTLPSHTPTTPPPTMTPSPTPTSLPTETSTPTNTPAPWGNIPLSPENAYSMVQRAVWGLGVPQSSAFAANGNVFVQGTPYGIYLYQVVDLQLIRFLPEAGEFHLSPNGDLLFSRLPDGKIIVVHLPEGEILFTFEPIAVLSPWMKDNIYAQLPADRPTFDKMYFLQVSQITAMATSPNGNLVALGFGDASIGLWDLQSGALVRLLKNDIVGVSGSLVFSPNGEKLLSTGDNSDIAVWQVEDGQLLWRLPHIGHIDGQSFSADGSLLALAITQGSSAWVAVRETRYGEEQGAQVVGVLASQAISPDNTRLVTTWYGIVKIWSIPGLRQLGKIDTGLGWPQASFSPDGMYILINDGEQAYLVNELSRDEAYPTPTPSTIPKLDFDALRQIGHLSGACGVRFPLPDHGLVWGTDSDSAAWVYDLADEQLSVFDFGSSIMADPDLSYTGDRLAACTGDGLIVISLPEGQTSNLGRCRDTAVVRFSTDGETIFRANGTLIDALDSSSGELRYNLRGHAFLVESLEVTDDGKYLVSSSNFQRTQGRELIWWQVDEPRQLRRWMVSVFQGDRLFAVDVVQEDSILYAALGGLRGWRLGDGQPHHLDTSSIASLAISPDNRLVASGDYQGIVHIWSLEIWDELIVLPGHLQSVTELVFSPDGTSLLSLSIDGTMRLWGLP